MSNTLKEKIRIINCSHERLKKIFLNTVQHYALDDVHEIRLVGKKLKGSTMQAQPVFNLKSLFSGISIYRIRFSKHVRGSRNLKINELPEDVLTGWFAHEIGHVKDYTQQSFWGMIGYGFRYLTSASFRKKIEHRADTIAIENGFHEEVLATKKFLFSNDLIESSYRDKMKKYYMPLEDVEEWIYKNVTIDPVD